MTIRDYKGKSHYVHGVIGEGLVTLCGEMVDDTFPDKSIKAAEQQEYVDCNICKGYMNDCATVLAIKKP